MRFPIIEYCGKRIADTPLSRLNNSQLDRTIKSANELINSTLGWKVENEAIVVSNGIIKASGVAGIIHLSCGDDLEIIPRHLTQNWQEALFFLAIISRYGGALLNGYTAGDGREDRSLFDLCGMVLINEFISLQRQFVRTYHHHKFRDFAIEGDLVFESYFDNSAGFLQEIVLFDKSNQINATIQEAMRIVLPYVSIPSVRNQLEVAISKIGKQPSIIGKRKEKVPSRNKEWEMLYSLSFDIVSGKTISLTDGEQNAIGFVVDTWRIWEWLLSYGLRTGLKPAQYLVEWQDTSKWGTRSDGAKTEPVNVVPDIVVYDRASSTPVLLVDAKCKSLTAQNGKGGVSQADLYEAFAFCNAKGLNSIILAYPTEGEGLPSGQVIQQYRYSVSNKEIYAIKVAVGRIPSNQKLSEFAKTFANQVMPFIQNSINSIPPAHTSSVSDVAVQ